jgi:hypothetical protein
LTTLLLLAGLLLSALLATLLLTALLLLARFLVRILILIHFYTPRGVWKRCVGFGSAVDHVRSVTGNNA